MISFPKGLTFAMDSPLAVVGGLTVPRNAISIISYALSITRGRNFRDVLAMHEKYGPVVRIHPNCLSYSSSAAWTDIYTNVHNKKEMQKNPSQVQPKGTAGIFEAGSYEDHMRIRKNLRAGFSEKMMQSQEGVIKYYIDLLITRMHGLAGPKAFDIACWYNFTTFDITGALTFGEDFDCLKKSQYHEWIATIFRLARALVVSVLLKNFYPLDRLAAMLMPNSTKVTIVKHGKFTKDKLQTRIEKKAAVPDFMTPGLNVLDKPDGVSRIELEKSSETLVLAGSDTTASLMTAVTYALCKNPEVMTRLTNEIRSAFKNESDITILNVNNLKYQLAVLDETLRLYPPVPGTSFRLTNKGGAIIDGRFVPEGVLVGVSHWSASRSSSNFKDPESFVPERWMGDEKYANDDRAARQPFLVGPRNCLGMNLAYAEMRLILARMIWNFDFELEDDKTDWFADLEVFFLWTKRPLMVRLKPVKRD